MYHSGFDASAELLELMYTGSVAANVVVTSSGLVLDDGISSSPVSLAASELATSGVWHSLDIFVAIGPGASLAAWLNGSALGAADGELSNEWIDEVRVLGPEGGWNDHIWLDDVILEDGTFDGSPRRITAGRLAWLEVKGDVTSNWLGSDGDSASNHLLLSDYSLATYVSASAASVLDVYEVSAFTEAASTIYGVIPVVVSAQVPYTQRGVEIGLKIGGASSLSDPLRVPAVGKGSWTGFSESIISSADWSASELSSLNLMLRSAE
jgi:hypothetical protein